MSRVFSATLGGTVGAAVVLGLQSLSRFTNSNTMPAPITEESQTALSESTGTTTIDPLNSADVKSKDDPIMTTLNLELLKRVTRDLRFSIDNCSDHAKYHAMNALKYGVPSSDNLRFYRGYVSSINFERRTPNWTLEYFDRESIQNDDNQNELAMFPVNDEEMNGLNESVSRKNCQWFNDHSIPKQFRGVKSDLREYSTNIYKWMNMSRGHLAAAGNHDRNQIEKDETFNVPCNIVPQEITMNGCQWYLLEKFVLKLIQSDTNNDIQRLWVVNGPIYFKELDRLMSVYDNSEVEDRDKVQIEYPLTNIDNMVGIPTHLFKIVLIELSDNKFEYACFVQKNGPIEIKGGKRDELLEALLMLGINSDDNNDSDSNEHLREAALKCLNPASFSVNIKCVEHITGLLFFQDILHQSESNKHEIQIKEMNVKSRVKMMKHDLFSDKHTQRIQKWFLLSQLRNYSLTLNEIQQLKKTDERLIQSSKEEPSWLKQKHQKVYDQTLNKVCLRYQAQITSLKNQANEYRLI